MKRKRLVSHFDLHGNGNFGKRKVKNVGSHDASREGLLLTRFDLDTIYVHRKDGTCINSIRLKRNCVSAYRNISLVRFAKQQSKNFGMETDQVRSIFAVGENHPLNPQSPVDFASYEGIEAFLPSSPSSVLEVQLVKSVGEKVIIEPNAASLLQKRTCCESSVFRPISCDEGSIKEDIARASKDPDDQRLMSYSDDDSAGGENENDLLGLQFLTDEKKKSQA